MSEPVTVPETQEKLLETTFDLQNWRQKTRQ